MSCKFYSGRRRRRSYNCLLCTHFLSVCPSARLGGGGWSHEAHRADGSTRTKEREMHNTINTFMARVFSSLKKKTIPCSSLLSHIYIHIHTVHIILVMWVCDADIWSYKIEAKGGNCFLWMFLVFELKWAKISKKNPYIFIMVYMWRQCQCRAYFYGCLFRLWKHTKKSIRQVKRITLH